jgi:RimK family alpha-L-glutamate ligase
MKLAIIALNGMTGEKTDVLSRNNSDLMTAANDAGIDATVIEVFRGEVYNNVKFENSIKESDALLMRHAMVGMDEFALIALLAKDKITLNRKAIEQASSVGSKLWQQTALRYSNETKEYAIPTYPVNNPDSVARLMVEYDIPFPIVLKPDNGSLGKGIYLIRSQSELRNKDINWNSSLLLSSYIDSDGDYRVFVLGERAFSAMKRTGNDNPADFVAKSGGVTKSLAENEEIDNKLKEIALQAARVIGVEYAGVDIIIDKNSGKYFVLEINSSGGWINGYGRITGVDIPDEIMKWFVEEYRKKHGAVAVS